MKSAFEQIFLTLHACFHPEETGHVKYYILFLFAGKVKDTVEQSLKVTPSAFLSPKKVAGVAIKAHVCVKPS